MNEPETRPTIAITCRQCGQADEAYVVDPPVALCRKCSADNWQGFSKSDEIRHCIFCGNQFERPEGQEGGLCPACAQKLRLEPGEQQETASQKEVEPPKSGPSTEIQDAVCFHCGKVTPWDNRDRAAVCPECQLAFSYYKCDLCGTSRTIAQITRIPTYPDMTIICGNCATKGGAPKADERKQTTKPEKRSICQKCSKFFESIVDPCTCQITAKDFKNLTVPSFDEDQRDSILLQADQIINGQKREAYGECEKSFQRIAIMWSVIFDLPVTPLQVCLAMDALKTCRELNRHDHDSLLDKAGYTGLAHKVAHLPSPLVHLYKKP